MSDIINKFEQFQTLESTQKFFQGIPDDCKENIFKVLKDTGKIKNIDTISNIIEIRVGPKNNSYGPDKFGGVRMKIDEENGIIEYDEYHNYFGKGFVGKQLCQRSTIQKLNIQERLPIQEDIQILINSQRGVDQEKKYGKFYNKYIQNNLLGYYKPEHKMTSGTNSTLRIRLKDGSLGVFTKGGFSIEKPSSDLSFFHVMFLKEDIKAKENLDEIPELESENYKIDTHLSVEEKLKNGWTKEIDRKGVSYLHKDLGGGGEIREYLAGVDRDYIGRQKFNRAAIEQLGLKDKLPKNYEEFKKIIGNNHINFLVKYFSNSDRYLLDGAFDSDRKIFYGINILENYWVGTGYSIELTKDGIGTRYSNCNPKFGMSVRLVKGR